MKQRIITGVLLFLILIPVVIFEPHFLIFQFLMIIKVGIGALEMINIYKK